MIGLTNITVRIPSMGLVFRNYGIGWRTEGERGSEETEQMCSYTEVIK